MLTVADAIAESVAEKGVDTVFTLLGSSNFSYTEAMRAAGAQVYRARHENGAVSMATAWGRVTGRVGICTLPKGPGLTHGLTALVEARKSNTPLLVLAADTPTEAVYSSPAVAQEAVVKAVRVTCDRLHSPESLQADIERAYRLAERNRQPVVLLISSAIVKMPATGCAKPFVPPRPAPPEPAPEAIATAVEMIAAAKRPVLLAGLGVVASGAGEDVRALGRRLGGVLTTTILAHGLFAGEPASLGISGGYAKPETAVALAQADLVLALGASLNDWTTRARSLFPDARVIHVDLNPTAFGRHHPIDLAIQADLGATGRALTAALDRHQIATADTWDAPVHRTRQQPSQDASVMLNGEERIRPRALTDALNELLPEDRTVTIDGGGCLEYSVGIEPPEAEGWVFPVTYMSIGLGLSSGIGAAIGRPEHLAVVALGDACTLSALGELETVARLKLPMLIVIYNDAAHAGELSTFTGRGRDVDLLKFPDFDFAAVARGAGMQAATVRNLSDLTVLSRWQSHRDGPLLLDAKVTIASRDEKNFSDSGGWTTRLMQSQGL